MMFEKYVNINVVLDVLKSRVIIKFLDNNTIQFALWM